MKTWILAAALLCAMAPAAAETTAHQDDRDYERHDEPHDEQHEEAHEEAHEDRHSAPPSRAPSTAEAEAGSLPVLDGVGADFRLDSTLGRRVGLDEFRGRAVLVYFGYTNCADICPLTTAYIQGALAGLGPALDRVRAVLVTVDPEHDTPERLAAYLAPFGPTFVGLTGSRAEVDATLESFMADHKRVSDHKLPLDLKVVGRTGDAVGHIYNHTARIHLLDTRGRTRAFYYLGTDKALVRAGVLSVLAEDPEPGAAHPPRSAGETPNPRTAAGGARSTVATAAGAPNRLPAAAGGNHAP